MKKKHEQKKGPPLEQCPPSHYVPKPGRGLGGVAYKDCPPPPPVQYGARDGVCKLWHFSIYEVWGHMLSAIAGYQNAILVENHQIC